MYSFACLHASSICLHSIIIIVQFVIGCIYIHLSQFLIMPHMNVSLFFVCVYIRFRSCPTIKISLAMPLIEVNFLKINVKVNKLINLTAYYYFKTNCMV